MLVSGYEMRVASETWPDIFSDNDIFRTQDKPASLQLGLLLPYSFFNEITSLLQYPVKPHGLHVKALLLVRDLTPNSESQDKTSDLLLDTGQGLTIPLFSSKSFFFSYSFDPEHDYDIRINLSLLSHPHHLHHHNSNNPASASNSPLHSRPSTPAAPTDNNNNSNNNNNNPKVTTQFPNSNVKTPSPLATATLIQPSSSQRSPSPQPTRPTSRPHSPSHTYLPQHVLRNSISRSRSNSPQPQLLSARKRPSSPLPRDASPQRASTTPFSATATTATATATATTLNIPTVTISKSIGYIQADFASLRHSTNDTAEVKILGLSSSSSSSTPPNSTPITSPVASSSRDNPESQIQQDQQDQQQQQQQQHIAKLHVKWPQMSTTETLTFVLEMRMRIQLSGGWPFSARRPFFILYRWETDVSSWSAVYRSEVLTEPSQTPDAQGAMIFRIVTLPLPDVIGDFVKRPLRFEFFHYKMAEVPKLLGYMETSVVELRQKAEGSRLLLVLNILPKGELVGNIILHHSRISASRYFFSLQANFGGPVDGTLVFFSISVVDYRRSSTKKSTRHQPFTSFPLLPSSSSSSSTNARRDSKPYFSISRYSPSHQRTFNFPSYDNQDPSSIPVKPPKYTWEEVYRSEFAVRALNAKPYMYRAAKITERKLNACQNSRVISVNLYQNIRHQAGPGLIAYFLTDVDTLLEETLGSLFLLIPGDSESALQNEAAVHSELGYAKLEASEKLDARMFFSFRIFLGESPPPGSHIVKFPKSR